MDKIKTPSGYLWPVYGLICACTYIHTNTCAPPPHAYPHTYISTVNTLCTCTHYTHTRLHICVHLYTLYAHMHIPTHMYVLHEHAHLRIHIHYTPDMCWCTVSSLLAVAPWLAVTCSAPSVTCPTVICSSLCQPPLDPGLLIQHTVTQ